MININNLKVYGVIYKIENNITKRCYIGKTRKGFNKRYNGDIYTNTHNEPLKKDIEKYGIENFNIIEVVDIAYNQDILDQKEQYWINMFKDNIYNIDLETYNYNKRHNIFKTKIDKNSFKKVRCIEDGKIFNDYLKCASYYNVDRIQVFRMCNGNSKIKNIYDKNKKNKYHFEYV